MGFQNFTQIATASIGERVPKVAGAWYFGLPFVMDTTNVTWANYFGGVEPRAFMVGVREAGHAQEGQVYPLDHTAIAAGVPSQTPLQAAIDAKDAEVANFIGFAIEGTDYENDSNMTVALAAGIPESYLQQDNAAPAYALDPALTDEVLAELPVVRLKGHIFWNSVQ